jgi:TPR repeat protein
MLINLKKHVFKILFCLMILSSFVNTAFSFNVSEKKLLALKGNNNTQYQLGLYYQAGKNIDVIEAYYWMKMAAEQNHPPACRYMGRAHLYGKGTSSSIDLAKKWFLISSNQGNANSMQDLGYCFELEGKWMESAAWYKTSHQHGNTSALTRLENISQNLTKLHSEKLDLMVLKLQSYISAKKNTSVKSIPSFKNSIKRIELANGYSYWGETKNGRPHGFGKKMFGQVATYQGEYNMGVEHGYGTSFDKYGLISFQGQWNNGVPLVPQKEMVRDLTNY